ncbi:MAG: hypothetical protein IPL26_27985 [Leptospiraceae bacterium]|nr:hypothetical protein [Leptospiraceae bacterium]
MVHKSTFLNWLKTKIDGVSKEDERDHVQIECCLIRAVSEYREKELCQISIDDDFNKRLMNRLEHIELESVGTYTYSVPKSLKFPVALASAVGLIVMISAYAIINVEDNSQPHFHKFPTHVSPMGLNSFSDLTPEENALFQELKKNPDNIRLLEKLENYYSGTGKKQQAYEIHSMLETVAKKY